MSIFRQLMAIFVALSLLTPATTSAAPSFLKTGAYFRDQVFKYDAKLGFFVNKTDHPDNICRHIHDYNLTSMLDAARKKNPGCAGAYYVPPIASLAIPQIVYSSRAACSVASAGMRAQRAKLPRAQLAYVAEAAADAMSSPLAFTQGGLSFDRCGRPTDVFSEGAIICDALGWILKKACDEFAVTAKNRRIAYRASEIINDEVLSLTGHTIVALSDEKGRSAVVAALREAAKRLRET